MANSYLVTSSLHPLVAISPHYDDAVFSCGHLLAAVPPTTVVTVYTGCPACPDMLTDWDGRCGFNNAVQAIRTRSEENDIALSILQAEGMDLDFLDSQYLQTPPGNTDLLIDTLASTLSRLQPASVVFPLGLFHGDHIFVSDALITLSPRFETITWIAYEDIPYSRQDACVDARISELVQRDVLAAPFAVDQALGDSIMSGNIKKRAVTALFLSFPQRNN